MDEMLLETEPVFLHQVSQLAISKNTSYVAKVHWRSCFFPHTNAVLLDLVVTLSTFMP